MRLDQFDKLEQNIKNIVDYIYKIKIENHKLKNEIENLKKQLDNVSEKGISSLKNKNGIDNNRESFPIEKKEIVVSQLDNVLEKLKNLSRGVEFK